MNEPKEPLRVAMLLADDRDEYGRHDLPQPYFGPAPSSLIEGFSQTDGVEIHIICCVHRSLPAPERIAPNIFYHALRVPKLGWLRTAYAGCIVAVRRLLRRIRPHVVHGQGTERATGMCAAYSGYPNVLTIHGNMRAIARAMGARPLSFHGLTAFLEGWVLPRVGGVICLSNYTREQVAANARRTWVVPNAVGDAFFRNNPARATPAEVVCVARICNYKNQNALITALDPVAARQPFRLIFAGIGPDDSYFAEFRRLIAARPWCQHAGQLDAASLRALYARASLGVLPTLEDNCPMVILEAAAGGLPFAASNVGGVPDLIEDGKTGVLFDPRNPTDMRDKIAALLAEPTQLTELGARARARAEQNFRPSVIAAAHLQIYRGISLSV